MARTRPWNGTDLQWERQPEPNPTCNCNVISSSGVRLSWWPRASEGWTDTDREADGIFDLDKLALGQNSNAHMLEVLHMAGNNPSFQVRVWPMGATSKP